MNSERIFPACHVTFNDKVARRGAAFYLAAEEFLAREMPADNYVFTWRLSPTCVFGRNQDPMTELNLDFCRRHGVEVMRRRSGGGTIFADEGNLMTSLVAGSGSVEELFGEFSRTVAAGLRALGVPASVGGRNDIMLDDGRKICGAAFYRLKNRNIAHCTMLYDTNADLMRGCLTPGRAKIESKGVKSVEGRIGLLKEYLPYGVQTLQENLISILTDRSIVLPAEDIRRIEEIEKPYHSTAYLFPQHHVHSALPSLMLSGRIEGCGNIEMHIFTDADGTICDLTLSGDYFPSDDADPCEAFRQALLGHGTDTRNASLSARSLIETLIDSGAYKTIRNLTEDGVRSLAPRNR